LMSNNVVDGIRTDWEHNQRIRTRAKEGKVWGWQWGGEKTFEQVASLGIKDYIKGKVLEIGCGGGKWTKHLLDSYDVDAITAIDVHTVAIEETRAYEPRARVLLSNGETLDFPDSSFDTVFCFDVLLHLPPPLVGQYMAEAYRVAKKGGRFVSVLPDMASPLGRPRWKRQVQNKLWRRMYTYGFMTFYTWDMIYTMMDLAGWPKIQALGHIGAVDDRDLVFMGSK